MNDTERIKQDVWSLLDTQKLGVLSTQGAESPYASLVCIAGTSDLKYIYFATPRTTRKFANLMKQSHVAMLIDNRSNREADIHKASAVTVIGNAVEVTGSERDAVEKVYLEKHPYLEDFVSSPTCALMRVAVFRYYLVSRFQQVMELHIDDHSNS